MDEIRETLQIFQMPRMTHVSKLSNDPFMKGLGREGGGGGMSMSVGPHISIIIIMNKGKRIFICRLLICRVHPKFKI